MATNADRLKSHRTTRQGLVKKRKRRLLRRLHDLLAIVMAGFLAYGTYWLWGADVWHWQGQMSITGNRLVSKQEILNRLSVPTNTMLYRLNPQWVASQLTDIPTISKVAVRRWLFPARLELAILERSPLVGVEAPGQPLWMDQEGVVFPASPKLVKARFAVKVVTNLKAGEQLPKDVQAPLFEVLATWPKGAGGRVDLRKPHDAYATVDDWPLRLGEVTDVSTKFGMFAHLKPLAQKYKDRLQYIDLRFPASPTFKLRSGDTIDAKKSDHATTGAKPGPTANDKADDKNRPKPGAASPEEVPAAGVAASPAASPKPAP